MTWWWKISIKGRRNEKKIRFKPNMKQEQEQEPDFDCKISVLENFVNK